MDRQEAFSIKARTCTLGSKSMQTEETILGDGIRYVIPIYQRPYSWGEIQIRKFLSDIFMAYWGVDGNVIKEPMFIGTMQLGKKDENKKEQDIIDGQQRLTTFLILLKVLKLRFSESKELQDIQFNWLETQVNNGVQQDDLIQLLSCGSLSGFMLNLNPYVDNAIRIRDILIDLIGSEGQVYDAEDTFKFDVDDFVTYIFGKVYFVVIETNASLSKTIQIFNSINTTGLDLNGGDIFKLRMFEYLCGRNNYSTQEEKKELFKKVNDLYSTIEMRNQKLGNEITNIFEILDIYKYILITKFDLPKTLYFYETNRFFEELFDTLLEIGRFENFNNVKQKGVTLSLETLEEIIKSKYLWHSIYEDAPTVEDYTSWYFIWWSRYSRYHIVPFIFSYRFSLEGDFANKLFLFKRQLSKLYIIYSIRYQKIKSEIYYSFMYDVLDAIVNKSFDEVMYLINSKIGTTEDHKGDYHDIEMILNGDITYNAKLKNIICRLSALLEEEYLSNDKNICENIFSSNVDIEHIQSYHDSDGALREEMWTVWGEDINSIGNLMVLEKDKNRSIGNSVYAVKTEVYKDSIYRIVKSQVHNYSVWSLKECRERKQKEIRKILDYLFGKHDQGELVE